MRDVFQRLLNHIFMLFVWMSSFGIVSTGAMILVFSNWINFSDAWNVIHPSVGVANDRFLKTLVVIMRDLESDLSLPHYLSRLLNSFTYGHGYAISQTIGTLFVETLMAWSLFSFIHARQRESAMNEHLKLQPDLSKGEKNERITRCINVTFERRRYLTIFLISLSLTVLIWFYDFYLTYAKQVLVSNAQTPYLFLGPLGTIILMTVISIVLGFSIEEIRRELNMIVGDIAQLIEQMASPVVRDPGPPRPQLENEQSGNGLQPPPLPPPVEMVVVQGINGTSNVSFQELNSRWMRNEFRIDGRSFSESRQPLQSSISELHQVMNPPEEDTEDSYYSNLGIGSLDGNSYEQDENGLILLRHRHGLQQ